jgi:flavorubredoxin
VKALKPPLKFAAVLSSYGWGGGTIKQVQEVIGPSKMEIVGALEINGPPTENDISKIVEIGKTLAGKIKASSQ